MKELNHVVVTLGNEEKFNSKCEDFFIITINEGQSVGISHGNHKLLAEAIVKSVEHEDWQDLYYRLIKSIVGKNLVLSIDPDGMGEILPPKNENNND